MRIFFIVLDFLFFIYLISAQHEKNIYILFGSINQVVEKLCRVKIAFFVIALTYDATLILYKSCIGNWVWNGLTVHWAR